MIKTMEEKRDNFSILTIAVLLVLNLAVWYQVFLEKPVSEPEIYFLDVGQGDATLVVFPKGVKVLVDAGYGFKAVMALDKILKDKYIDLAIVTHPQLDHFGGFNYLLDRYKFGAFIVNGRNSSLDEWQDLVSGLNARGTPIIRLAEGSKIAIGSDSIKFLSPTPAIAQSGELNDTSFVNLFELKNFRMLLTGDAGFSVENFLTERFSDLEADVLKVGHHGSKYSSSEKFLEAVRPRVAVIEVGKNKFGHPTEEVLSRLKKAKVFRTDKNGTVEILVDGKKLQVFTER